MALRRAIPQTQCEPLQPNVIPMKDAMYNRKQNESDIGSLSYVAIA